MWMIWEDGISYMTQVGGNGRFFPHLGQQLWDENYS